MDKSRFSSTNELLEACSFAKKWLPPITQRDKDIVSYVLTGTGTPFGTALLRQYIKLLRPYLDILGFSDSNKKPREADCAGSGIVFFYGCLCYIMHFPNWGRHIRDIFLYNLLYILVDHYIDDIRIDPGLKETAIAQMFILLEDPSQHSSMPLIDPVLKTIALVYQELITRCPATKKSIFKLFQSEVDGLKIQKDATAQREKYYDIALRKGGYTMEVLHDIVGNTDITIREATFHIGTIMQLIDDSVDILTDMKNGIHTIATCDLTSMKNLDTLWLDIMHRISTIDRRFVLFIFLYTIFAVYLPDRLNKCYSENLRRLTNPLNLFECDGSYLLVEAVMCEITAMELLSD